LNGAQILGVEGDALNEALGAALERLAPYRIGRTGALQEWQADYEECTPGMGHVSHLYSVYPASIINERDYPDEYRAAYLSLQRRVAHAGMTMHWPGSWALCLAARFHDRTLCTRQLASVTGGLSANLLVRGFIQIDAIFGFAAGIGEMLLQSHNGYIEFLPTPAYGWRSGSFSGMRARGGFECGLSWKDDKLNKGRITSLRGQPCRIKAQGLLGVKMPDGSVVRPGGDGIVSFDTEAGATYELIF
ncbi:MAG: glycoside hydrolase family 95 protein, partial [Clostridia bacterium]|nr:glycoside hydrolase family 95 protein [Clostridia bacterium]